MPDPYVTVFRSTLQSTVWQRPDPVRIVWMTLLMLADQDGCVFGSIPGIAYTARVSIADCETALREFQQPDHYSRDPSNDGRRIEPIEGGLRLLNYAKWVRIARKKARLEQNAEHQRAKRKSLSGKECQQASAGISPEAEAEADTEEEDNPRKGYSSAAADACPHQDIIALYHELLPCLPPVKQWTAARQAKLRQRWREDPKRQNLDWWRKFFSVVAASDFLCGRAQPPKDRRPFVADLEWLISPHNFVKILEGRYD